MANHILRDKKIQIQDLDLSLEQLKKRWNVSLNTIYLLANQGCFGLYVRTTTKSWGSFKANPLLPFCDDNPDLFIPKEGCVRLAISAEVQINSALESGSIARMKDRGAIDFLTFNVFGHVLENGNYTAYSYRLKQEPAWHLMEQFKKLHPDYKGCFLPGDLFVFLDQIKRFESTEDYQYMRDESSLSTHPHHAQEVVNEMLLNNENFLPYPREFDPTIQVSLVRDGNNERDASLHKLMDDKVDEIKEHVTNTVKEATVHIRSPEFVDDIAARRKAKKQCSNAGKEGAATRKTKASKIYKPYGEAAQVLVRKHPKRYGPSSLAAALLKDSALLSKIKVDDRLKPRTLRGRFSSDENLAPFLKLQKSHQK